MVVPPDVKRVYEPYGSAIKTQPADFDGTGAGVHRNGRAGFIAQRGAAACGSAEFGDDSQCDGGFVGGRLSRADAYLVGPRSDHRRIPVLRGTDHGNSQAGPAGREHDFRFAGGHQRCAGIHGAHFACAFADLAECGRDRGHQRRKECVGACVFLAPGRSEGAGGVGDAFGIGSRPRPAARFAPGRAGSRCAVHQRQFSRLDHGVHARRTFAPD